MIDYKAFKGRKPPAVGDRVAVYRKIIGGKVDGPLVWSVRYGEGAGSGLVAGHARRVTLIDVVTYVNVDAQQRIAAGGVREVHAWVTGTLTFDLGLVEAAMLSQVSYRPHESPFFHYTDRPDRRLGEVPVAHFNERGMWA